MLVALQTMVFAYAGVETQRIQRNVTWLLEARGDDGSSCQKAGQPG